jgi:hypothetical protein
VKRMASHTRDLHPRTTGSTFRDLPQARSPRHADFSDNEHPAQIRVDFQTVVRAD